MHTVASCDHEYGGDGEDGDGGGARYFTAPISDTKSRKLSRSSATAICSRIRDRASKDVMASLKGRSGGPGTWWWR